jgi:hypothetical protein
MKHAGATTLDQLEPLLARLRALHGLKEKSRGVFYWKSRAFLHFHEDDKGIFADMRDEGGFNFDRFDVTQPTNHYGLLEAAAARLGVEP